MAVFPKKWSFDLKNWGLVVVQKAGKFGRLQVTRLQIYYGVMQAETTLFSFEESQSFDLSMTRFPFLLQHRGLLIFEMKQPLFWKNGQILSLPKFNYYPTIFCVSWFGFLYTLRLTKVGGRFPVPS